MSKPLNTRGFRLLSVIAAFLIAACGQKGPLYLPGNPSEIQTQIPNEESQPEAGTADAEENDEPEQNPE